MGAKVPTLYFLKGEINLNKLKLYRIDIDYVKYLYRFDKRVQYNEKYDSSK